MAPDGAEWLERTYLVEIQGVDHETATPYWMRTYGVRSCERMNADGNPMDAWRSNPDGPCELNVSHAPDVLTVTAWEIASVESTTTVELPIPELRQALLAARGENVTAPVPRIAVVVPPDSARALRGKAVTRLPVQHTRQPTGRYSCPD